MATENLGEPNFEDGEEGDAEIAPDPSVPNPADNPELDKELATDPDAAQEQFANNNSVASGTAGEQVPQAGPIAPAAPFPGGENLQEPQAAAAPVGPWYQCLTTDGQPNTDHPVFQAGPEVEQVQCPVCGSTSVIKTQVA